MKSKIFFVISACFFTLHMLNAQVVLQRQIDSDGIVTSLKFRTDTLPVDMDKAKEVLNSINKMQVADDWRLEKSSIDNQKTSHQYYLQYYKGIRVAYGTYALHGNDKEQLELAIGNFQKIDQVNTTAQLSESEALQHAMKHIGAELYKWQIPEEERWIKEYLNKTYHPQGEMVIVKDILQGSNQYRLAYKFDIYAHKPLSRYFIYVDAIDGKILDKDSRIHRTNSQGTAATRYSGTRNIITDSFGGGFRLREVRNGVRIETYNMNNTGIYSQTDFVDNDNNWIEHNNANRDNAALDAHWGAEMTFDYFRQVHGRNSYDNGGSPLLSYTNANLVALGYQSNDNAFWDGNRMTYGRGTAASQPFTTLDICAHEIAHGVTGNTARLVYRKESGAINESLSDIWAACVETWAAPEKQRWLMGEDIGAIRSMSNPNQFNHPDTYLGTNWINTNNCTPNGNNDYCGVHSNSGVVNHWFFLLSEGGTGTNDIGNFFWVGAIGMNNAARIVYRTQSVILQSSVEQEISFAQFREATIIAASNIFGNNSYEVAQVTNAWYAVGVGNTQYQPRISGPSAVCDQATYTIQNLPAGATVQWSVSNNNLILLSQQGGSATFKKNGNGRSSIQATLRINNQPIPEMSLTVDTGTPIITGINGITTGSTFYPNSPYSFSISNDGDEYFWTAAPAIIVGGQGTNTLEVDIPDIKKGIANFRVSVKVKNECGWSSVFTDYGIIIGGTGPLTISPNPATDVVTVQLQEETAGTVPEIATSNTASRKTSSPGEYEIQLWSAAALIRSYKTDLPIYTVPVSDLPRGMYFIRVIKNGKTYTQKLLKN